MRVVVTGAAGFVGSNVVHEAVARSHDVVGLVREAPPHAEAGCAYRSVDLLDREGTLAKVAESRPDAVIHTAILNDLGRLYAERQLAWDSYVGATRTLADAANAAGALLVTVSTDWVFDGLDGGYEESAPPNPVNLYGVLKALSEVVTLERAQLGTVARIAGVMGTHRARPSLPRGQDAGFGYFVASIVDSLERGDPFTIWESDSINMRATPSLASHSAGLVLDVCERRLTGTLHCVGGEATTRMELALATADVFGLDPSLLRSGCPDPSSLPPAPVPYDTSLVATETAAALETTLPSVRELLGLFREERRTARA